jgi:hypothetical protein
VFKGGVGDRIIAFARRVVGYAGAALRDGIVQGPAIGAGVYACAFVGIGH